MPKNPSKRSISRRTMLGGAAAATAFTLLPGGRARAQNEKLNIAIIGTGGQGIVNMRQLLQLDDCRIAALCDVRDDADYSMFYYGGRAGLDPALALVKEQQGEAVPTYADYNEMLDKEDIDAVLVATPDHTHAMIGIDAVKKGKHIYLEKPLCRTMEEVRLLTLAARQAGVATQMGNYGHSGEYMRTVVEMVWNGDIGDVREVHCWANANAERWTALKTRPTNTPPVPQGFDWETWLGPMPSRPYSPEYAPARWRSWWEFGTGTLGDFACHHLDPAFWALKIGEADRFTMDAVSTGVSAEVAGTTGKINYRVPARAGMPPVHITWYEGGEHPEAPEELDGTPLRGDAVLLVGSEGSIVQNGYGGSFRVFPKDRSKTVQRPPQLIARVPGHHQDWLNACKGEGPASDNFEYAGPLTEFVLAGNAAIRAGLGEGKVIDFDWKNMRASAPEAQQFIGPKFREGVQLEA